MPPGFNPGDARGEAPCIRKLKTPLPRRGRALCERGRGDGGKQLLLRQANPATGKASPSRRCRDRPLSQCHSRLKCRGAGTPPPAPHRASPPPGTYPAALTSAARVQPRGCKGRSPLHKKTKNSPFPPGRALCERGVGGMGAKRHCYGRQIRKPKKPASPPMPRPPSFPMPLPAQVPGHQNAAPRPTQGKPPPGTYPAGLTSAARVQPRGCKGRSPLHKKTKNPPSPEGKSALRARAGGMGANNYCYGRQIRQPKKPASPPGAVSATSTDNQPGKPPAGHLPRRLNQCRPGSAPGMQGAKPLA